MSRSMRRVAGGLVVFVLAVAPLSPVPGMASAIAAEQPGVQIATSQKAVTYAQYIPPGLPWTKHPCTIPPFNPALGSLQYVRVRTQIHIAGTIGVENAAFEPQLLTVTQWGALQLHSTSSLLDWFWGDSGLVSGVGLGAWDGSNDYQGASGTTYAWADGGSSWKYSSPIVWSQGFEWVRYVQTSVYGPLTGFANGYFHFDGPKLSGTVTVTYIYN